MIKKSSSYPIGKGIMRVKELCKTTESRQQLIGLISLDLLIYSSFFHMLVVFHKFQHYVDGSLVVFGAYYFFIFFL